jgi:hypothetical protein
MVVDDEDRRAETRCIATGENGAIPAVLPRQLTAEAVKPRSGDPRRRLKIRVARRAERIV